MILMSGNETAVTVYRWLADLVLLLHFGFVLFVVLGLALVWVGYFAGWLWVRNLWFRLAHIGAMGVVLLETMAGIVCPLTIWEANLRTLAGQGERYQGSFMEHWIHRLMFFDLGETAFTVLYAAFFGLIALSFWFVPPRRPPRRTPSTSGRIQ